MEYLGHFIGEEASRAKTGNPLRHLGLSGDKLLQSAEILALSDGFYLDQLTELQRQPAGLGYRPGCISSWIPV